MEYPKIETVFVRDETTRKVVPGKLRLAEFSLITHWLVTEKIDGTNVRVHLHSDGTVIYGGRTDNAQLYAPLIAWLLNRLPATLVVAAFDPATEAILFGEGYGPKIQKGGIYRKDVAFRLFDVAVLTPSRIWWLNWENVEDVAKKCDIETVPVIGTHMTMPEALALYSSPSRVAHQENGGAMEVRQEGIVCRTDPLLFDKGGRRIMWKLKGKDF